MPECFDFPWVNYDAYMGVADIWIDGVTMNAHDLLERVRGLLHVLSWDDDVRISSGYRDAEHNAEVGGARKSLHTLGRAIDLADSKQRLYNAILARHSLLEHFGLWMECGEDTPSWVHLDTGMRRAREIRVFKP